MNLNLFYENKRILITGNTGFKGSWLNFILKSFGAKVYGYSLPPKTKDDNFNLLKLKDNNTKYDDIRNYNKLKDFIKKIRPEIVFHLSAQALVKNSYKDPHTTFSTNAMGTLNILDILKDTEFVKSIVIVTSDKCYKNLEKKMGYSELDEIGGLDPYSASKASAENIFYSYYNSYFKKKKTVGAASVRAGNVIGGGDWSEDRIVPDYIKSIIKNKIFFIRSPNAVRPWQHVFDLLNGYLILARKLYLQPTKYSGSYNFGPDKSKKDTVLQIIQQLKMIMSIDKKIFIKADKTIKETTYLKLKITKSKKILKWKPKLNLKKSLELTGQWYRVYLNNDTLG